MIYVVDDVSESAAVKHYSDRFQLEFVEHLERTVGSGWFFVAEVWLSYVLTF